MSTFAESMCNDQRLTADNAEFFCETARTILESMSWEHLDLDSWKWFVHESKTASLAMRSDQRPSDFEDIPFSSLVVCQGMSSCESLPRSRYAGILQRDIPLLAARLDDLLQQFQYQPFSNDLGKVAKDVAKMRKAFK